MPSEIDIEQFERAFSMHISGPVAECDCGKVFWDTYNTGYDWDEGEEDRLRADPNVVGVRHGVERIALEGRIYCMDCSCWHERAERIATWLRDHQEQIGEWFKLEKRRLAEASQRVPAITE